MPDDDKDTDTEAHSLYMIEPGIYGDLDEENIILFNPGEVIEAKQLADTQELRASLYAAAAEGYKELGMQVVLIDDAAVVDPDSASIDVTPSAVPVAGMTETQVANQEEEFDIVAHGRYRCDDKQCPWCYPHLVQIPTEGVTNDREKDDS